MRAPPPLAFAVCVLVWGGSWLAIRAAVTDADPVGIAASRTLVAFALLFAIATALRIPRPDARGTLVAMAIGAVFIGANFALVFWSAPRLPVGFAAIAYSTTPLQAALLSPLFRIQDRVTARRLLAVVLGIVGIVVAFGGTEHVRQIGAVAALAVLLGATTSALGTVMARRWNTLHPLWMNVYANLAGFMVLAPYYAVAGDGPMVPQSGLAWAGFAYMVLGGSVLAMLLYFGLVRAWDATRATFTTLATPFVALVLGFVVAGEPILAKDIAGAMVVVTAGYLALTGAPKARLTDAGRVRERRPTPDQRPDEA